LGDDQIVKALLDAGADVNGRSYLNLTPLIEACKQESIEIMNTLLEYGADINCESEVEYFETPLVRAIWSENFEIVKVIVDNTPDVNHIADDGYNRSPLQIAIFMVKDTSQRHRIMKYLIENGADISRPGLLHYAIYQKTLKR
jgi:ankyrin repeat protein